MYKAGKNWLVAILTVASFILLGTMIVPSAKADTLNSEAINNNFSVQLADQSDNKQQNIQNSNVNSDNENTLEISTNKDSSYEDNDNSLLPQIPQYNQSMIKTNDSD